MKHAASFDSLVELFAAVFAGLDPAPELPAVRQMVSHWLMVKKWNVRTNLTAITDDEEAAWLHYRDSLEALAILPNGPVIDIGSGAGFPGIPIGLAQPDRSVTLLEPRRKRTSFLETSIARLHQPNIRVIQGRSTDQPDQEYAAALSRATFSEPSDLAACLNWLEPSGILIAFRSEPSHELTQARVHRYSLRGDSRVLQVLEKS